MFSLYVQILFCLVPLLIRSDAIEIPLSVEQLPVIVDVSEESQVAFPVYEEFSIKCNAKGNPAPVYKWTKDGKQFNPNTDPNIKTSDQSGSFTILPNDNISHYDGVYRCYASNPLGTAMSEDTKFIVPGVPKFPNEAIPPVVVEEGKPVVLRCDPPQGLSPVHIYWMTLDLVHIPQDERVSVGLDGNLYFANVITTDDRSDYCCFASFSVIRTIVQKLPMTLTVQSSDSIKERPPRLFTPHGIRGSITVLRGEVLLLECIADGLPTPRISWQKNDSELPPGRTTIENFGKHLKIKNIMENDHGIYRCTATNNLDFTHHDFHVQVEEPPRWKRRPESSIHSVGSGVAIHCSAAGKPEPDIRWKRNGQLFVEEVFLPNYQVRGEEIIINNLQLSDSAVYQCEATNKHGTILASANIDVLDIAPLILTPDNANYTALIGQAVSLLCNVFAVPPADVSWYRVGPHLTAQGPYENGTLHIENTEIQDAGTYMCYASNARGNVTMNAHVILIEPTRVSLLPENPWVKRSHSITLTCYTQCDVRLLHSLRISWWKNGLEMTESTNRLYLQSDSLSIPNVTWEDAGSYRCIGRTSMDSMEAETRLIVRDVPSNPDNLHLSKKHKKSVTLSWTPSDSHNSPISEYLIQSKRSRHEHGQWEDIANVARNVTLCVLHLKPYYNYQFRVIARNEMGLGPPSASTNVYSTPPAVPDVSPRIVYAEADKPNEMMIKWEPLSAEEHNGPELRYRVSWRLQGVEPNWHQENVKHHQFLLKNTPAFTAYDVSVQSINELGSGPEPQVYTVYSGEDTPDTAPSDVAVDVLNSTVVKVTWRGVTPDRVRGHLSGYKITYWRVRNMVDGTKHHDEHHVLIFAGPREWGIIPGLSPFSEYKVSVSAFNTRGDGPASYPLKFETLEGVPEQPRYLRVITSDKNSFTLSWGRPKNTNGILKKYILQYQIINDTDEIGTLTNINITNPSTTTWRVPRMEVGTMYKFYLRACTKVGCGRAVSEEGRTMTQATYTDVTHGLATQGWFIGIMCAVALLTLVLLTACFVQRNKGGKYPVLEKEDPIPDVEPPAKPVEDFVEYR
ncbi:neural cell adhesion molecule L1-like protein isoform X2 [Pelobates fuscus]|uniref:neural cell adhesion molecule L1-like protein isoform X2 n=1 Tax=Pelobates fuscus TaxID=191477 RepID=UPI002FE4A496